MKKLLIIFLIILFPFYSYGKSLLNKGIICENTSEGFIFVPLWGFWFDEREEVIFYEHNGYVWKGKNMGKYVTDDFRIIFSVRKKSIYEGKIAINRNTGELINRGTYYKVNLSCEEEISDKEKFLIRLQKRFDEILSIEALRSVNMNTCGEEKSLIGKALRFLGVRKSECFWDLID